jgi:four helix bundle protein
LAELLRFIDIARGSLSELEYYIHFMESEGLLRPEVLLPLDAKRVETGRLLFGLWRSLKASGKNEWDHTGRVGEEAALYEVSF